MTQPKRKPASEIVDGMADPVLAIQAYMRSMNELARLWPAPSLPRGYVEFKRLPAQPR